MVATGGIFYALLTYSGALSKDEKDDKKIVKIKTVKQKKFEERLQKTSSRGKRSQDAIQQAEEEPPGAAADEKRQPQVEEQAVREGTVENQSVESAAASEEVPLASEDPQVEKQAETQHGEPAPGPRTVVAKDLLVAAARAAAEAAGRSLAEVKKASDDSEKKRGAARVALMQAIESAEPLQLQQALVNAQEAHLGTCAETELAESLIASARLLREALEGTEVIASPAELRGLSGSDAAAAELLSSAELTEEQLRERVVELSSCLAAGRLHARARLREVLAITLEAADESSLRNLEEGLKLKNASNNEAADKECEELEAILYNYHVESVQSARAKASEAAQQVLAEDKVELNTDLEDRLADAKSQHLAEVVRSNKGFTNVEDVVGHEAARIQKFQARLGLLAAVHGLEDAMMAGRPCDKEFQTLRSAAGGADCFVADLFNTLPPGCIDMCRDGAVPSEVTLKKHLPSQLRGIATAAFLPPGGGLAGEFMAHAFEQLYFLGEEPEVSATDDKASADAKEVRSNLSAISRALQATEPGTERSELEEALRHLDTALTGTCKEAADKCIADARTALLLRQALWAAKARMWCLTATA